MSDSLNSRLRLLIGEKDLSATRGDLDSLRLTCGDLDLKPLTPGDLDLAGGEGDLRSLMGEGDGLLDRFHRSSSEGDRLAKRPLGDRSRTSLWEADLPGGDCPRPLGGDDLFLDDLSIFRGGGEGSLWGTLESELSLSLSSDSSGGGLFGLGDICRLPLDFCSTSLSLFLLKELSFLSLDWGTCFFLGGGEGEPDSDSESSLSSSLFFLGACPFLPVGEGLSFLTGSGDSTGLLLSGFPLSRATSFTLLCSGLDASLESESDSEDELSLSFLFGIGGDDLLRTSAGPSRSLCCLSSDRLCNISRLGGDSCRDLDSLRGDPSDSLLRVGDPSESILRRVPRESWESILRRLSWDQSPGGDRGLLGGDLQRLGGEKPLENPSLLNGLLQIHAAM